MQYVILTEKTKSFDRNPSGKVFWSNVYGMFSTLRSSVKYDSFEDAQPTVEWLRSWCPHLYFCAIPVPGQSEEAQIEQHKAQRYQARIDSKPSLTVTAVSFADAVEQFNDQLEGPLWIEWRNDGRRIKNLDTGESA